MKKAVWFFLFFLLYPYQGFSDCRECYYTNTDWCRALENVNVLEIEKLLKAGFHPNMNMNFCSIGDPLHIVIKNGHSVPIENVLKSIDLLVSEGADINHRNIRTTPISYITVFRDRSEDALQLVKHMTSLGADPFVWQFDEETNLLDQLQFENNADLYPVLRFLQEEFSCTFFMKTKYWIFRKPYCSKKEMCYLQKGENCT